MALDNVQPVPWVFGEAILGAAKRRTRVGGDEQVDRLGAGEVAAFHQHGAGTKREQRPPLPDHVGFALRLSCAEKRRRLGQVRRQAIDERQEPRPDRRRRSPRPQARRPRRPRAPGS